MKQNRKHRWLAAFLLCLCLIGIPTGVLADIPQPTEWFYVDDYAGVLSQSTLEHIVSENDSLYARTGAQIVVATVDFLDGMSADDYIFEMFNQWGIGSAEKNNGILPLLVIGEEDYRILQGQGLEEYLPSSVLDDMLFEYLEPDFAVGDYDAGVRKLFDALLSRLNAIYPGDSYGGGQENEGFVPQPEYSQGYAGQSTVGGMPKFTVFCFILAAFCLLMAILTGVRRRRIRRRYTPPPFGGGFSPPPPPRSHHPPPPPPPPRRSPPPPSFGGGLFGGGGSRPPRSGGGGFSSGFGGGRSGGGGFSRSSGGSRSRSGGGGSSRGGGAGRRR